MAKFQPLCLTQLPPGVWRTPITIKFGYCDPAGIVYTPKYFDIFNGAIESWYDEVLEISYTELNTRRRIGTGYAHASADFGKPCRMGDILDVAIIVRSVGRSSMTSTVHAFKGQVEYVRSTFVTVTTSLPDQNVIALPDDLRRAFESYRERCGSVHALAC